MAVKRKTNLYILLIITILLLSAACAQASVIPQVSETVPANLTEQVTSGILFGSDRDGEFAYYVLDPDSGTITKLNFGELSISTITERPVWSSALKRFFLPIVENGVTDIYSVTLDGRDPQRLSNTPGIIESNPVPSPDGNWIAFIGTESDNDVFVMQPDGSEVRNLTKFGSPYSNLIWSPDGSTLYFISIRSGTPNVFSVKIDGSELTNISKGKGLDASFTLSPDGETIAFDSDRQGMMDIFQVNAKGGDPVNLTNSPTTRDLEPILSPDGKFIAFRSDIDGGSDIYLLNLDDKSISNLTNTPEIQESSISWTPDGKLLFVTAINNQLDIFMVAPDGTSPVNLTNNPANDYLPVWIDFD